MANFRLGMCLFMTHCSNQILSVNSHFGDNAKIIHSFYSPILSNIPPHVHPFISPSAVWLLWPASELGHRAHSLAILSSTLCVSFVTKKQQMSCWNECPNIHKFISDSCVTYILCDCHCMNDVNISFTIDLKLSNPNRKIWHLYFCHIQVERLLSKEKPSPMPQRKAFENSYDISDGLYSLTDIQKYLDKEYKMIQFV